MFNTGLSSSQHQHGQTNVTDTSEQSNFPRLPIGQRSTGPPLQGQQNLSSSPLPGQQNLSNPIISGQPNLSGPPLSSQQTHNNTIMQGMHGQQNLIGSSLPKQNLSSPPLQTQPSLPGPPLSAPPLPGQHYSPLPGQQKPNHSFPEPPSMSMSNLSGPSLMTQQNIHPLPMSGQQNVAPSSLTNQLGFNRPPLLSQQNLPSSQMPPPIPGQPVGQQVINSGTNLLQSGQRPYTSRPPMQGQQMGNPLGINRSPPNAIPNYQHTGYQGYNNVCLF